MTPRSTALLSQLTALPTAPFAEKAVADFARQFAAARPRLRLREDPSGNLLIECAGRGGRRSPRWVFCAHMDHPGFVAGRMIDRTTLRARFHGGVLAEYLDGAKVRFFDAEGEALGVVREVKRKADSPWPSEATLRVNRTVAPDSPGMFDLGVGRTKSGLFHCRVCDDLAGAAACLAMLDDLARSPAQATVAVLLTRAEEDGFVGALAAVADGRLIRRTDRLIVIETSAAQPHAPQGKGPIIRVGDKTSIFNSALTWFLTHQAERIARTDKRFAFQRALMPGGTCEATVYDLFGYLAGSICIALGNYHNMDRQKKRLAAETVHLADWRAMVRLFLETARNAHRFDPERGELKARLNKRFVAFAPLLHRR